MRPSSLVELLEHLQDFLAGVRVEVAGRLVGEQQRRAVDQRPGDGHALLLAAGSCDGSWSIRSPRPTRSSSSAGPLPHLRARRDVSAA